MERPFTLLILLLLIGQLANGQSKQPSGSLQPPMPVAERHRNPDYAAPDSKQPGSRRRFNRPNVRGAYRLPMADSDGTFGQPHWNRGPIPHHLHGLWLLEPDLSAGHFGGNRALHLQLDERLNGFFAGSDRGRVLRAHCD